MKFTSQKYIISKARAMSFHECYINKNWEESKLASILISRIQPSGKFLFGIYLVDLLALGVKDTFFNINQTREDYYNLTNRFNEENGAIKCELSLAHNIIYGGVDFAEENGYKPHKDFKFTEYILDPALINDSIDNIIFGQDGKPMLII